MRIDCAMSASHGEQVPQTLVHSICQLVTAPNLFNIDENFMHTTANLSKQEFSDAHNAICELDSVLSSMNYGVNPSELVFKLDAAIGKLRGALAASYKADDLEFQRKTELYNSVAKENAIKTSIWSDFDVDDFTQIPFAATGMIYLGNHIPVQENSTWLDLWKAAEKLIRLSGDRHHIFIESITLQRFNGVDILVLSTGS